MSPVRSPTETPPKTETPVKAALVTPEQTPTPERAVASLPPLRALAHVPVTQRAKPLETPPPVVTPTFDELLTRIDAARLVHDELTARDLLLAWLDVNANHPRALEATFMLGKVWLALGERSQAAHTFQRIADGAPESELGQRAAARAQELSQAPTPR